VSTVAARLVPWLITAGCFVYLYGRLERAVSAQGDRLLPYLAGIFGQVSWSRWLMLMILSLSQTSRASVTTT
jgi:hypothetical protein